MNGYTDLIRPHEPLILLLVAGILSALSLSCGNFFFNDTTRSVTFAAFVLLFVFFARTILLSIKESIDPDLRTSTYLFIALAFLLTVGWMIRRTSIPGLEKFHGFLLLLFSTLMLYETGRLIFIRPSASFKLNRPVQTASWAGECKENIYVFMFDEYQGSDGLRKLTGFHNDRIEGFLRNDGFTVPSRPQSTYRITFYALPSLFAMDTLVFPAGNTGESLRLGIMAHRMLDRSNTFAAYLTANGYRLQNHSMFQLNGTRKLLSLPLGLSWLEIQILKTLPWWVKYDMLHNIPSNRIQKFLGTYDAKFVEYNQTVLEKTMESIRNSPDSPTFMYSHFLLPHNPLVFDSTGKVRSFRNIHSGQHATNEYVKKAYLDQVIYVNRIIESLVRKVDQTDPNASVVILSDHGSRHLADGTPGIFNILWAMRVRGRPVQVSEQDIELVNTFRILLNQVAGQQLPMLHSTPRY